MFKNLDLETFIEDLSSEKPTPGGGSVAALVGALASGLNNMVYSLTVNKKAFNNLTDEEKSLVLVSIERTKNLKNEFFKAMEEDKSAFEGLMDSYKLPKGSEEEVGFRNKEIEINTIKALEAPLNLARKALELYKEIEIGVKYGNKGAISDAGVSAILTHSTIESAIMNVKINLAYLTNEEFKASVNNEIDNIIKESIEKKEMFVGKVYSIIEG